MSPSEHPLVVELTKVQYDLTSLKARISEIQRQVAALNLTLPDQHTCECGVTLRSDLKLAEHRYTAHDGPEPKHWLEAEARAEIDVFEDETVAA